MCHRLNTVVTRHARHLQRCCRHLHPPPGIHPSLLTARLRAAGCRPVFGAGLPFLRARLASFSGASSVAAAVFARGFVACATFSFCRGLGCFWSSIASTSSSARLESCHVKPSL